MRGNFQCDLMEALRSCRSASMAKPRRCAGAAMSENQKESEGEAATEARLDQATFRLDPARYSAFVADLRRPVVPNDRLRLLMATPAPWQETDVRR